MLQTNQLTYLLLVAIFGIVYESDSIPENASIIIVAVAIVCAYFINIKKKPHKNIHVQVLNKQTQTQPFHDLTQPFHCTKQTQTKQQDSLLELARSITSISDTQDEQKREIETVNVNDANSAMKNSYDIISIQNVDADICCLYPYLKNGYTIIASQLKPHTIYFFNPWKSIHYKYEYITKQWNTICNLDDEHDLQRTPQCFHFNPKKGLIGVFHENETKIRIYDEINDEWSTIEIELKSDSTWGEYALALDTKSMIYHLVGYGDRHFTYNLNTLEFLEICKKIPFYVSNLNKDKLLYNKCTHTIIYLNKRPLKKKNVFEFNIEKQIWQEFSCTINNFEPGNWT
eukprot:370182_1